MRINALLTIFAIVTLCCVSTEPVLAQRNLNEIRIGQCGIQDTVFQWIQDEQKDGLVIDARPFAINQTTGISGFNGKTGHVAVVHMNPFVYKYNISVAQQELISTAVTDFIEFLLPEGLRPTGKTQSGAASRRLAVAAAPNRLEMIAGRVETFASEKDCPDAKHPGCKALLAMKDVFDEIQTSLTGFDVITSDPPKEVADYETAIISLRNEEADAYTTCNAGTALNTTLTTFNPSRYLDQLNTAKNQLTNVTSLANDLVSLVDEYGNDDGLKNHVARCQGFICTKQFKVYAETALELIGLYEQDLSVRLATAEEMKRMLGLTEQMRTKNGLFARTFDVIKKFELSAATVSIARERIQLRGDAARGVTETGTQSGTGGKKNPKPAVVGGASTSGSAPNEGSNGSNDAADENRDTPAANQKRDDDQPSDGGNANGAPPGQINESFQIGRPRFLLSGGLVFSPLRRQTFERVTGFARDADGNPTGDGNQTIVGFGENSPRRLLPMVILNTRLRSFAPTSVFFSLGVTGKHDDNIDIEYLLGPSVSMLNDRALFTFGAYVGKVENLVPDVKFGDEIPESVGDDAKLFTKRYSWKPGFSFSYVFSETEKRDVAPSGGGGDSDANDLKNEIRIGGIPFNLALGLAYTSLEDRKFDPIVGFARDRKGNLTNGQTLTRVVGLTSSSNYRMVPLALLHSRLLNFGNRSFYFSTGVTGRKTDNDLDIEYLLGGSVNVYRRKVFFTFGAFAGKQDALGGDFFTGAKLEESQGVTTHRRYVWKPAFGVSYDITRIIPRGSN